MSNSAPPKLLLLLLALLIIQPIAAQIYPSPSQLNCATTKDCPYGYYCPAQQGQIAQCKSLTGATHDLCVQNNECKAGEICAKDILKSQTYGTCQICIEHWSLKWLGGINYCYQDSSQCGTEWNKPINYPTCAPAQPPLQCQENWICGQWTTCINGQQDRACTDINGCNTIANKPILTQGCIAGQQQVTQLTNATIIQNISITYGINPIFIYLLLIIVSILIGRWLKIIK